MTSRFGGTNQALLKFPRILQDRMKEDIDGVLSTSATFTRTASTLSLGTHNIFVKARDSNSVFSEELSRQLVILPAKIWFPLIMR